MAGVAMGQLKKVFWEGTEDWSSQLDARAGMSGTLVLSDFTSRAVGRKNRSQVDSDKT